MMQKAKRRELSSAYSGIYFGTFYYDTRDFNVSKV